MKKMIDLIAEPGSHKDEKLLNYVRKNYLINNYVTNICFISGKGENWEQHTQISAEEFRKLVFEKNDKTTVYFLRSFFFDKDRASYLKLIADMCENNIQVFKTDQVKEHVTNDKECLDKYCEFLSLEEVE